MSEKNEHVLDDDDSLGDYEEKAEEVRFDPNPVTVYEGDKAATALVTVPPNPGEPVKVQLLRRANRTSKIARRPSVNDLEYHAMMTEEKQRFVDNDALVKATKSKVDAYTMLHALRAEMAAEAASLLFQRTEDEKCGKDATLASSRRLEALNKMAGIEFDIKKLGADVIDLHGERFQRVFKYLISIVQEVAQVTLSPEQIDLFFNRLGTAFENWEEKASEVMAGAFKQ